MGAIGSRRTQEARRERLRAEGLGEADVARLHGPIGLDLGGRETGEVALAILAEVIAVRHGASARPMSAADVPMSAADVSGSAAAFPGSGAVVGVSTDSTP